jgi:hypothetical protein
MNIIPKRVSLGLLATVTSLATHVSPVKADLMDNIQRGPGQNTRDLNRATFQLISDFDCTVVNGKKVLEGPYSILHTTQENAQTICDAIVDNFIKTNAQTPDLDRVGGELKKVETRVPETY